MGKAGIFTSDDMARLERAGMSTFLVGENLMRQPDVVATRALLVRAEPATAAGITLQPRCTVLSMSELTAVAPGGPLRSMKLALAEILRIWRKIGNDDRTHGRVCLE